MSNLTPCRPSFTHGCSDGSDWLTTSNSDLAERILNSYLFPDLSPETDGPIVPQIPIMHTDTRQKLYNIVNLLCKRSDVTYSRVMEVLEDVVPRGMPKHALRSPFTF